MIECALEFAFSRGRLYVDDSKMIPKTEEKYMQVRSSPSSQRKTRIDELASMQNGMLAAVNAMSKVCVWTRASFVQACILTCALRACLYEE